MVELIWDGKYKDGKRTAPLKVALPFQTVETVNESAQQRQRSLEFMLAGRDADWRNRLIWGDKKYVLPSLLPEFAGKVDLIYIDPPFATGQDFSFNAQVGDERFTKEASIIEQKAYRDTWGEGANRLDSYLKWLFETVVFLHELLSETGSLYIHLDSNVSHYGKVLLDSVFGFHQFKNEIVWKRTERGFKGSQFNPRSYNSNTEMLLFFGKTESAVFHMEEVLAPYEADYLEKAFKLQDATGRYYLDVAYNRPSASPRPNLCYEYRGFFPPHPSGWKVGRTRMQELDQSGELVVQNDRLYRKIRPKHGRIRNNLWDDIKEAKARERVNYPTQKPEALLERIIRASSSEGDLVLDCFCGSGTTPAVAEKLNRRWIACDLGRFAIHTSRKRLLGIENVRPFVVQNLGKYERQVWQKAEFGDEAALQTRAYRKFILDLYHAELVEGYAWLHGRKGGRMVHVGSVDSPVAVGDVRNIALEFRRAIGAGADAPTMAGVDVLGWDFALDMNETAGQIAQEAGLGVRFLRIPREVLEQKAVDQGDIQFFELAALSVGMSVTGRELSIELTDFMIPPDDVPDDVMKAVRHWSDWIDYWAVDWNYRDDTFHNEWQSYRTRKDRTLLLRANHRYAEPGEYVVLVKVIDILGNDSTKTLNVKVV